MKFQIIAAVLLTAFIAIPHAQVPADRQKAYDDLLDLYVRDGQVYYRALKAERARFDGYVNSLATASLESATKEEQIAFWEEQNEAMARRLAAAREALDHDSPD